MESVAENFVDGFLAVVFWFVCGCLFAGWVGWPPMGFAIGCVIFYRVANTLDAMIGHNNDDGLVKSQKNNLLSFRRKPESSNFNMFWMPDQVRHDGIRLFTRASMIDTKNSGLFLQKPMTF